jgi:hypothetical protein
VLLIPSWNYSGTGSVLAEGQDNHYDTQHQPCRCCILHTYQARAMLLLLAADALNDCCQVIRVRPHLGHAANLNLTQQSLQILLHLTKKGGNRFKVSQRGFTRSVVGSMGSQGSRKKLRQQCAKHQQASHRRRQLDSRQASKDDTPPWFRL